jgi:hypothetical protein
VEVELGANGDPCGDRDLERGMLPRLPPRPTISLDEVALTLLGSEICLWTSTFL